MKAQESVVTQDAPVSNGNLMKEFIWLILLNFHSSLRLPLIELSRP